MKTHAQLSKAKDGEGKKKNLKLAQLTSRVSNRITRVKNAFHALEMNDEYFFGYTDIHLHNGTKNNNTVDFDDLEARYGLL